MSNKYAVEINLFDEAEQLDKKDYNELIVDLFKNTDEDSHIQLMYQMFKYMYTWDQKLLIEKLQNEIVVS
jgi:hypothetical protein